MAIKERNSTLDLIRIIAAFCVVVNHAIEFAYSFSTNSVFQMQLKSKLLAFSSFTFGRIGVTLFLLLSGYLLLNRDYDQKKIMKFYKHNLLPLLICWELWCIIYEIFTVILNHSAFDFEKYIRRAFFVEKGIYSHSWYMPMIISMYLFLPLVAMVINRLNAKHLLILLGICFIYSFVVPAAVNYQNSLALLPFNNQTDMSFGGGAYGVYLVTGYMLAKYKANVDKVMKKAWAIIGVILIGLCSFAFTVAFQIVLFRRGYYYMVWYNFPGMIVLGICVFLILSRINLKGFIGKAVIHMGECAFGIYLVHELYMCILRVNIGAYPHSAIKFVIYAVVTFIASYATVALLSLIPKVGFIFMKRK